MFLGKVYFLINRKERMKIIESVKYVFDHRKEKNDRKKIIKNVFRGILSHYYEKIYNAYESTEKLGHFFNNNISTDYLQKLDDALKKGRGVLLVTGHYGGIEYIPIFLGLRKYPVSVVAKFATEQLETATIEKTKPIGMNIINAEKSKNILLRIMGELRRNRVVFFECDEIEEWKQSEKEKIFFLRKLVGLDRTINILQKRTNAEIIFGLLHRTNLNQYRLILEDKTDMISRFGGNSITIGEAVLKTLEYYIYSFPEEWYQWKNFADIESTSFVSNYRETVQHYPMEPVLNNI
jgi:lauroyl/myristoyl acyltransferase